MSVRYFADWSQVDRELDRLIIDVPSVKTLIAYEQILSVAFEETQSVVHVQTGSLRGSGRTSTVYDMESPSWEGKITYGGPSVGFVNDPVEYAWYEQRRGGTHDFMRNVHLVNETFYDVTYEALGG